MKNFLPFFLLSTIFCKNQIIKNGDFPSCRNCIFYKPYYLGDYSSELSKCEKFGNKNILTDEIKYDYADLCRRDENKCGIRGQYFEQEEKVDLKIVKHAIIKWFPWVSFGSLYIGILLIIITTQLFIIN